MRDKRPVDELSIEELERILAIRKREARQNRLRQMDGRRVASQTPSTEGRYPPLELDAPIEKVAPDLIPEAEGSTLPDQTPPSAPAPSPKRRPRRPPRAEGYSDEPMFEDDLDASLDEPEEETINWKVWWNRGLLMVEIAAVIGLVALFVGLFQSFQEISQRTASVQAEYEATARAAYVPPTATPMINIGAVVLPSGHTFQGGEAVFNLDEVPVQYRDQYAAYRSSDLITRPTPSAEAPIRVRIPRIGVDSAVVAGDDFEALKLGVGHHLYSANPGQIGNMVLSAHNDVYGEIFRYLDQLTPGDEIIVTTRSRDYTYVVEPQSTREGVKGHIVVQPTDVWVMGPNGTNKQVTLISCYPYRVDNKRIVVFASLRE